MATSLPGALLLARAPPAPTTRCSLRRSGAAARAAAPPRSVAARRSSLRAVGVRFLLTAAALLPPFLPGQLIDAACPSSPTHALSFSSDGPRSGGDEALRPEVEAAAVPRSVPVRVAYELHQAGHRYLDVRYATLQPREHSLFLFPATGPFDFHGEGAGRCHGAAERRRLRTNINS